MSFKSVLKSSIIISLGLLAGRILGYTRDIVIAQKNGIGEISDQLIILLTFPDFINNLISSSSIGVLIIPLLSNSLNDKYIIDGFLKFSLRLTTILFLILASSTFIFFDYRFAIVVCVSLLSIFPNIINVILNAYLNFKNEFLWPSLGTFIFLIPIISILLFSSSLFIIAIAIIFGAIIRLYPSIRVTKKFGLRGYFLIQNNIFKPNLNAIVISIFSSGIFLILPVIDKMFASQMSVGSISFISFSEKIVMLPVSLLLTPIAVANFPKISQLYNNKEFLKLNDFVFKNLLITLIVSFIVIVVMYLFTEFITSFIFGLADLETKSLKKINEFTVGFLGYLFFSGLNLQLSNFLFVAKKIKVVFLISISLLFLKLGINTMNLFFYKNSLIIVYATSVLSAVQFLISFYFVKKTIRTNENH